MKVLLREDVSNLGYAGEVVRVADGYGRNYLIPRGLAVKATPGILKEARVWRERASARAAEMRMQHEALAARIRDTRLVFTARAGETGKLYGSVTTSDICQKLNEKLGTDIDRRNVVGNPLRQLGEHKVTVKLSREHHPQVAVFIHPEGELETETATDDEEVDEALALEAAAEAAEDATPEEPAQSAETEEETLEEANEEPDSAESEIA